MRRQSEKPADVPPQPSILHCLSSLVRSRSSLFYSPLNPSRDRGLIGPTRQFGTGSIYHPHLYAIIIGAFLPFPFWFWQRRYPNSWIKYVSTPVILNGVSSIPPATGINYSSWFAVGFVFQYLIRKKNFPWWSKFNYVASAALDSGQCCWHFRLGWKLTVIFCRDGYLPHIYFLQSAVP